MDDNSSLVIGDINSIINVLVNPPLIRSIKDVRDFYDKTNTKLYRDLGNLFKDFLKEYEQSTQSDSKIISKTLKAIEALKVTLSSLKDKDYNKEKLQVLMVENILSKLSKLESPALMDSTHSQIKEVVIPWSSILNFLIFCGLTSDRIEEICSKDKASYFCNIVGFLLGTKKNFDKYTEKISIDVLISIIVIFLFFIFLLLYTRKILGSIEVPFPGNGFVRLTLDNKPNKPKFKSKKKSLRKSLRK
jgi:hypothetical protein